MELLKDIERFAKLKEITYILYSTGEAMSLFKKSTEALIESNCFDFDLCRCSASIHKVEVFTDNFPVEEHTVIDKNTYHRLHSNLCQKVKKFIINPMIESSKEKQCNSN